MDALKDRKDQRVLIQRVLKGDQHGAPARSTNQANTEGSDFELKGTIHLRAQLAVVHNLKEGVLLRGSEEAGAPGVVLPHGGYLAGIVLLGRGRLQRGVSVRPFAGRQTLESGIEKHHQDGSSTDIQIGGRNRTI